MQLTEKYRPRRFSQLVGQDKAVSTVAKIVGRKGWDRDSFWISGPTGTGKTSLARCIAESLGCDEWNLEEIDGDQCSVDRVRKIADSINLGTLGANGWRVWIVNEAQAMTARAVQAWLALLEKLPAKRLVIFTTTEDNETLFGQFAAPFMGRCKEIALSKMGLKDNFARLAKAIAQREGMDGKPLSAYERLVQDCHNSMRKVLHRIEAGEMSVG